MSATSIPRARGRYRAIVLAGGAARRLGGVPKPAIPVGGVPMIERVLAAVAPAGDRAIVVGPPDLATTGAVHTIQEHPPGGGPVAAIGAAFEAFGVDLADIVTIVGGDLPLLTAAAVRELTATVSHGRVDGAVYVDASGRRQWLCGAWRTAAVADRLAEMVGNRGDLSGAALHDLFGPLAVAEVRRADDPPPWFDCDTQDDIRRAEEWLSQ
jgi:molybdopterin-guanine dinucleotide biosynthesis protein A